MKRLKRIWITLIIVILSVTMILGIGATTAFAASGLVSDVVTNKSFYSKFVYGKDYTFDKDTKVIEPNGNVKTSGTGSFTVKPTQVGAYTVIYGDYSYNVPCELEKEYELRVDYAGAEIATFIKVNNNLKIPAAYLYYKDEDGNFVKDTTQKVYYQIDGTNQPAKLVDGKSHDEAMGNLGTYNVIYFANLLDGKKVFTQSYKVMVQDKFDDNTKPTLNVVNVPSEISLKTKVTLPTATATDDYDTNVKVEVTVKQYVEGTGYVNVKEADVDENGYGVAKAGAADLVFDNKNNMSFYPLENTTYQITYQAYDDTTNFSTFHQYTAKCVDKTAPVLKKIADDQIPTKWGYQSVTRGLNDGETNSEGQIVLKSSQLDINFPYPEYVDNDEENISVSFEIKDTINNKTVIRFNDIYDYSEDGTAGAGAKYSFNDASSASNGLYDKTDVVFTKNGLSFNFANYVSKLKEKVTDATYTGVYTVTYRANDKKPNISTKSYDLTLEETLVDKDKPTANVTFEKDYLLVTDEEQTFNVPSLISSDTVDTRTLKEYYLTSGTTYKLKVEGGETAKIVNKTINGKKADYLIIDEKKGEVLELDNQLGYSIGVKDDAGNLVKLESTALTQIPVLTIADFTAIPSMNIDSLMPVATDGYKAGVPVNVGSFTFTPANASLRDYTGFEMTLLNADNKVEEKNIISFTTYFDGTKFVVKNITFTPKTKQAYKLYIRVFDATGKSIVKLCTIDVGAATGGGNDNITSTAIPQTGNVFTTYQLKNKEVTTPGNIDPAKKYIVRNIEANGKFSLMNTSFTAYNKGLYQFNDGYYRTLTAEEITAGKTEVFAPLDKNSEYRFAATSTDTVKWEVQGNVPAYSPIDATADANLVKLPSVIANAGFENAKVTIKVVSPKNVDLKVATKESDNSISVVEIHGSEYWFRATENGVYTVTYSAANATPITYEIKAGDAVAPSFTVSAPNERETEGRTFQFDKLAVEGTDNLPENVKNMTFTKRLTDPTGNVVYKVEGKDTDKRDAIYDPDTKKAYKFEKTGTYQVEYSVTDEAGNKSTQYFKISVSAKKTASEISTKIISTVLIIVGVLLIAGVILYFVRFRKIKNK